MTWNNERKRALSAFIKHYRDHPDGYSPESIGTNAAHFHEIINGIHFKGDKEK